MLARSVCFLFRNSFLFVLLILPAVRTTSLDFLPSYSVSDYSNNFSAPQTSSNTFKVLSNEEYYQNLDADSDYSSSLISSRPFNPLSADSYLTILRQNNFYGTWRSCDKSSKPFENYFLNPTGLMILEVLNADITQGGNYFAKLPNLKKDVVNFHTSTTPARILGSGITWSVLVKLYDGDFVDENSANVFYQFADETAFTFTPANATLSVTNGIIDIYLKDGDGDSTYYKRCMANFSMYFSNKSGEPYKDILREASDIRIQFDLTSPDCNVNFSAGVLTTDGFEDSSQVRLLALISSIIALLELYGAYKIKSQIKNRKMVYKTAMGSMWMIATVDYYMLILNLVLIFAFSLLFIVPFFLYMFVTFYLERDIIIRILQETNKRQELDIADESCRSCGFYFGLSTVMFVFELVFILMSKLWVIQLTALIFIPQIIHNAKRDKPAYFNFYQVFLLGIVRIVFIAYLKYYPANIFRLSPDLDFVVLYSSIMVAQVVILLIQIRFPRLFFICSKRKRNRVLTEEDVCPICMGNFKSEAPTMADSLLLDFGELIETPCAHVFHVECLKKWVKSKVECPVCRSKISEVLEEVSSEEESVPSIERIL